MYGRSRVQKKGPGNPKSWPSPSVLSLITPRIFRDTNLGLDNVTYDLQLCRNLKLKYLCDTLILLLHDTPNINCPVCAADTSKSFWSNSSHSKQFARNSVFKIIYVQISNYEYSCMSSFTNIDSINYVQFS
jgi:hypothetical protein